MYLQQTLTLLLLLSLGKLLQMKINKNAQHQLQKWLHVNGGKMSNGGATKPSEKPFKVNVKVVCAKTLKF